MALGMGVVFVFLLLLVGLMRVTALLLAGTTGDGTAGDGLATAVAPGTGSVPAGHIAAAVAAVHTFRSRSGRT